MRIIKISDGITFTGPRGPGQPYRSNPTFKGAWHPGMGMVPAEQVEQLKNAGEAGKLNYLA